MKVLNLGLNLIDKCRLEVLVLLAVKLTILDAILTYSGYTSGYLEEANPILAKVLDYCPNTFLLLVMLGASGLIILTGRLGRHLKWVKRAMFGVVLIKIIVLLMHLVVVVSS